MTLQGVLLDIDGTLVLSNDAHARAWIKAFAAFGYSIQFEQIRPLIGMGSDQIFPQLIPGLSSEEGEGKAIAEYRKTFFLDQLASAVLPSRGSRQLVLRFQAERLRLMVVSSATSEELSVLLRIAQVEDLLPEATTSSDTKASKPAPDLVQAALSKAQLLPHQVLMLGDTPYDIQSARAAGVSAIALRCGGFNDMQLEGALAIYDDPAALAAQYEHSPFSHSAHLQNANSEANE